jgi:hypothetical protein
MWSSALAIRSLLTLAFVLSFVPPAHAACPPSELFSAPTGIPFPSGSFPVSLATGDFDGDGHLDVAITMLNLNQVAVLRGLGDGSFADPAYYPAGPLPRGIVAADFDSDGALDLAVSDVGDSAVRVLLGQRLGGTPTGSFAPAVAYRAGAENRGMVTCDWNGDGVTDLAVAGRTSLVVLQQSTALGVGTGVFTRTVVAPAPGAWSVTVGDWGPGGAIALIGANWTTPTLTVTGGPDVPMPAGSAEITTGDVDLDGYQDLVVPGANGIRLVRTDPAAPPFRAPVSLISDTHLYNDALVLDVNGDALPDIAATDADGQQLVLLLGAGDGTFPVSTRLSSWSGPNGIAAGDFDEDGRTDLLVVNSGASLAVPALYLYRGRCGADPRPVLTDVRDVPHDQGGRVFVTWTRSARDNRSERAILSYRVWRRIHPPGVALRPARDYASFVPGVHAMVARPAGSTVEYWEPIAEIPAAFLDGYGCTAPTTQDSIAGSNPYTAFFVQALTSDPLTFYASATDSGYSVDDLAPPAPLPFAAVYSAEGVVLHWAASTAPDFARFRLHRGSEASFVPDASNRIAVVDDTTYSDRSATARYYKLAAEDVHGNVGRFALVSPDAGTAVEATCVASEVVKGRVRLIWYLSTDEPLRVVVQRRDREAAAWEALAVVVPDGEGFVRFEDAEAAAGSRLGYRLALTPADAATRFAGEAWVEVPAEAVLLAPQVASPVRGAPVTVTFTFPPGPGTRVDLLDVSGRVVATRTAAAGTRTLELAPARSLPPGLYFVRVALARPRTARVVVVD